MKLTAGRADRRYGWITAFRRSWRRAVIRRLPSGVSRWVLAVNRWQRRMVAQMRSRWHRSLQLRVVTTTLVLSALVIAVLGFFLVESIEAGLLHSAENTAGYQAENGRLSALGQTSVDVLGPPLHAFEAENTAETTARALQQASGNTGSYLVFVQLTGSTPAVAQAGVQWVGPHDVDVTATIPQDLITDVTNEQRNSRYDNGNAAYPWYEPTTLTYTSGPLSSGPAIAVGVPLGSYYQL